MSGSPIVDENGAAIGLISTGDGPSLIDPGRHGYCGCWIGPKHCWLKADPAAYARSVNAQLHVIERSAGLQRTFVGRDGEPCDAG